MNIYLISYGDIEYDGRLRSFIRILGRIGKVYSFTRGGENTDHHISYSGNYLKFLLEAVAYGKELNRKLKGIDVIFLDNRKASIAGLLLKNSVKFKYIIQDSRELYLINETQGIVSKIGCIFEGIMVRKANIVICANSQRASIMQKQYKLKKKPIVYENFRKLQYSSETARNEAEKKLGRYIRDDEVRIISVSGCLIKRTIDVLVRNLSLVNRECRLFLVGESDPKEKQIIEEIASKNKRDKIEIIGQLDQSELKYLISECHIGIVNYGQYDLNNKYCASGKLYEFLYEGIPVVTTTNPPLRRLCERYGIGIADDSYFDGINEVLNNYPQYKNAVKKFVNSKTMLGLGEKGHSGVGQKGPI